MIIHDETLHRTTNGTGQVADYTLAELWQFRLPNGECIPTLADFLQLVGTAPVQLDLEFKTDVERYPGIEETVLPLVKEAPLAKPVIFSFFKNTEEDGIQVQLPVYDADVHENYHLYIDLIGADQYQIVDTGWLKDEFSDAGYTNN